MFPSILFRCLIYLHHNQWQGGQHRKVCVHIVEYLLVPLQSVQSNKCQLSMSLQLTDRLTVGNGVYNSLCGQRSIIQHLWSHGFRTHEVTISRSLYELLSTQISIALTSRHGHQRSSLQYQYPYGHQFWSISFGKKPTRRMNADNDCLVNLLLYVDSSQCWITLRASKIANLSLLKPIAAEPCFTASTAYSTWWIRPWGDQVETSLSYWFLNYMTRLSILQLKWLFVLQFTIVYSVELYEKIVVLHFAFVHYEYKCIWIVTL